MSKTAALTIRMDPVLKQQSEKLLREMGLTPSQAITLFYTQIHLHHGLPFLTSSPSEETLQAMEDMKEHRNVGTFSDVDALREDLEA